MVTVSRRIVDLRNGKSGTFGPLSHQRSRLILSPTGSWPMVRLYGIRNCDTVRKARRWLDDHAVEYRFHDLRAHDLVKSDLLGWIGSIGWENLINRRGTTWHRLRESERHELDEPTAIRIMLDNPTIIKRPILDLGGKVQLGFSEDRYRQLFRQPVMP